MPRLTDINVPLQPRNDALRELKRSALMRGIMAHLSDGAVLLYQAKVAKRSGALARSARPDVEMGGHHGDEWTGGLIVGTDHALPHEFTAEVPLFGDKEHRHRDPPARDMNFVLEHLGEL